MDNKRIRQIILEETSQNGEVDENVLNKIVDPFRNMVTGVKGVWRGEGYDFYKYLSELRNVARDLQKLDQPNNKIMDKLTDLSNKIQNSKMEDRKKRAINAAINKAQGHFEEYSKYIKLIETDINKIIK
jgi:seryl-tRNA synthetase